MRAVVCGAGGAMGTLICDLLEDRLAGKVSLDEKNGSVKTFGELKTNDADMVIDFSHHTAISDVVNYALSHRCALVVGTTAHTEEEKALIHAAAKEIPVFYCGNMSLGIAVLCDLAKQAAACFPDADIEIVEVHHNRKVDAPSGTALMLANAIQEVRPESRILCGRAGEGKRKENEIGISSLRMGNVVGIHEVHICAGAQSLTLRHEAFSRSMLAEGAMAAAEFLSGKPAGLYDMQSLLAQR